ncbi:MAG: relaxase/mobilization nuclease domain-containing protein [Oscillospiraceae bacterium]|nr:relaxase/mobilization nuclease domain-containing protein [Oscillospiraceae bacterium]
MATLKHIASKNADYGAAEQYLTFEHDEFSGKPILDENGRLVPREDYRISSLNCGGEDFAIACLRANLRYGKNQQREDVKSHHYIISFDPRDGPDHGLTVDKAQELGERFCAEHFPGHQALICTHPDGHNHSGNIHIHIIINSLRVQEVERKPYMDRACDTQAGAKHRCTAAAMRYLRAEVMEMCQDAGLYQIDLLGESKNRVTDREYWVQKKGQLTLDQQNAAQGKPPTKFETDKEKLRQEIRAVLAVAVSFEDFAQRLLQRGITVKESRGRLSYLTPDRTKPITARRLGDDFDRTAVGAVLERNAARSHRKTPVKKQSIVGQLRQSQGVQRMVDIDAKRAQGKGIGYECWAATFNLKQAAKALNIYTEYGFSSPEELDAAISAAYSAVQDSRDRLKPVEAALKEKKELQQQIAVYRATKSVRDGLAAQKTSKARAAYRQEHEGDFLRADDAVRFFNEHGIAKLPSQKVLTEEISALLEEKNTLYTEYQEKKRQANELLTVKRNIEQVLHGAPSQRRETER